MKMLMFDILTNIFTCNTARLPLNVLRHMSSSKWKMSRNLREYQKCLGNRAVSQRVYSCATQLDQVCSNSRIKVIKTVRMRMDLVQEFMTKFPDIKVVYQWRDPRGILNSRWESSKKHRVSNFTLDTDILCKQMSFDLIVNHRMNQNNTGDFVIIKYEHLASRTQPTVIKLYNDLDLGPVPRLVMSWITQNTRAGSNNGPLGTSRTNSTAVAKKWKVQLRIGILGYITKKCAGPLFTMGYTTN